MEPWPRPASSSSTDLKLPPDSAGKRREAALARSAPAGVAGASADGAAAAGGDGLRRLQPWPIVLPPRCSSSSYCSSPSPCRERRGRARGRPETGEAGGGQGLF